MAEATESTDKLLAAGTEIVIDSLEWYCIAATIESTASSTCRRSNIGKAGPAVVR
jgi:hypothetical protein